MKLDTFFLHLCKMLAGKLSKSLGGSVCFQSCVVSIKRFWSRVPVSASFHKIPRQVLFYDSKKGAWRPFIWGGLISYPVYDNQRPTLIIPFTPSQQYKATPARCHAASITAWMCGVAHLGSDSLSVLLKVHNGLTDLDVHWIKDTVDIERSFKATSDPQHCV